jgi:endoglucanase
VTREEFERTLTQQLPEAMRPFGISKEEAPYFLPPFEWYNDSISAWTSAMGLQLVNFTHGTLSHADYTIPGTPSYRSSQEIYDSILAQESKDPAGLRGFILLSHVGTARERTDKFYLHLEKLIISLKQKGYEFRKIDQLLHKAKRQQ